MCIRDRRRVHGEKQEFLFLILMDGKTLFEDEARNQILQKALLVHPDNAKNQGCFTIIKSSIAPLLSWTSMITIITIIEVLYFIAHIVYCNPQTNQVDFALIDVKSCMPLGIAYAHSVRYYYEVHRLLMPILMHIGIFHLAGNSFGQLLVGPMVEFFTGRLGFLLVYFGSGVSASILFILMFDIPSLGASGSVYGLLGAFTVLICSQREEMRNVPTLKTRLILTTGLCMIKFVVEVYNHFKQGLSSGVGHIIHATGFLAGAALMYFVMNKSAKGKRKFVAYGLLANVLGLNALMLFVFYIARSPSDPLAVYPAQKQSKKPSGLVLDVC
eukprot:TRINITY_DN4350_c0_g1_i2.p1 TRINITY_DN4350_c0_g1~~TRINITY_DN4350_c0_g1_i2.p1  ORF type:complete len:348 (+),score=57.58 TRINITY_DN4350_c0_g1_i2:61-1044(+)